MNNFIEVANVSKFKNGTKKKIKVDDREILLVMIQDKFFAVDNLCPHLEGNLSRGKLQGTIIECPLHGTQFDLKDGKVLRWLKGYGSLSAVDEDFKASHTLNTYDVKIEGNSVLLNIT